MIRKRRKKNKLRGNRSHGKGNTKNKKGAGCRGGRGKAGSKKHKRTKYYKEKSKTSLSAIKMKKQKIINLDEIELLTKNNLLEKKDNFYLIDLKKLKKDKLLGRGKIKEKYLLINGIASKKAIEKIKAAGGKINERA